MNCVSWKCCGSGRPPAIWALKDLVQSYKSMLLGLIETKLTTKDWEFLRIKLGYECCFAVSSRGGWIGPLMES